MYPKKPNLKIYKIIPPSFAQALGKHKKESYETIHVFRSNFQSSRINLFVFNPTTVEKIWSPFHESKKTTFPGKFYYLIQIFHVIHVLPVAIINVTASKLLKV